jgi:alkylation response protein AidB-like acyl-CoA dehydrogenase
MDFRDSPDEAQFRARLRAWLAGNVPPGGFPPEDQDRNSFQMEWHRTLYKGGWIGLSWPRSVGGQELGPMYDAILNDELGAAGAPRAPSIGFLGRVILQHGTADQQAEYLPGLLSGTHQWCQGFSEPGAGSDLASLRTRADRTDGGYVVNGQKVWTSRAQWSDYCLLLARSDPESTRHRGLSCFVVKTDTPGMTIRPIVQISGDRQFCEVFYDSVFIPQSQRIGPEGEGWKLAMSTVAYERGPADIGAISNHKRTLAELQQLAATSSRPDAARRVARCRVQVEVLRLRVLASLSERVRGGVPGPEGSVDKLLMAETDQLLAHTRMYLLGAAPLVGDAPEGLHDYFWSRAATIYGGTAQIQKSIVAERVLGLPRATGPR